MGWNTIRPVAGAEMALVSNLGMSNPLSEEEISSAALESGVGVLIPTCA